MTQANKSKQKEVAIKLIDLTVAELSVKAHELRGEIAKTGLQIEAKKQKNVRKKYMLRKQLARTLTVLNMKLMR